MLSTSLPSYLWGDAVLTAAHLINRMPSRVLHLQTPLECLKESYPSTRLISDLPLRVFGCTAYVHNHGPNPSKLTPRAQACVFVGYPLHQGGYKCFHPSSRKDFVSMDVTFLEDRPFFPVSHLQGESESEESNSNWVISLESTSPTLVTIPSPDSHYTVLPTNQVPWKTYYRRNLRKEVGSPANQPAPVQDSEPLRDQGMTDSIDSHIDSKMSESDRSETAIPENIGEQGNVDTEVILDGKGSNDENEVSARVTQNSIREDRSENLI